MNNLAAILSPDPLSFCRVKRVFFGIRGGHGHWKFPPQHSTDLDSNVFHWNELNSATLKVTEPHNAELHRTGLNNTTFHQTKMHTSILQCTV